MGKKTTCTLIALGCLITLGGVSCIGDTDYNLCRGDDPLPECADPDSSLTQGHTPSASDSEGQGAADDDNIPSGDDNGSDNDNSGGDTTIPTSSECNSEAEPTWTAPVSSIMSSRCVRCHRRQCSTFAGITGWVNDGSLKQYMTAGHYISGTDKSTVLRWLAVGAPETDCDVP